MKTLNKTTKILIAILSIIMIAAMTFGFVALGYYIDHKNKVGKYDYNAIMSAASKTVLFIGDGMGFNHIKVTGAYYEKDMYMSSLPIHGSVTTFSTNLSRPTDSAAAGSALSTGYKFNNGEVARHNGKDIEHLGEYAKKLGLGVGIVTTDSLSGATPAAFSAHANDRHDSNDIISSQMMSNIDLFLGVGYEQYSKYEEQFNNYQYTLIDDYSSLTTDGGKMVGAFPSISAENGTNSAPSLDMLTSFAVEYMEVNYPNGYFIMVEAAHIDKRSHSNNIIEMTTYLNNFDKAIMETTEKFKSIPNSAVVITADHETGGLTYNGETKDQINNSMYTRTGHSSSNVPYLIYINSEKEFDAKKVFATEIDNTDISKIVRAFLKPAA